MAERYRLSEELKLSQELLQVTRQKSDVEIAAKNAEIKALKDQLAQKNTTEASSTADYLLIEDD